MMNALLGVLHPSFDALSAFADLSDVDGARTRVGGHVKGCAQCRLVVDEIRELGAGARASAGEGAPMGLWARIESAAREPKKTVSPRETLPADAATWAVAPSLRPTRLWPVPMPRTAARLGLGLVIAAAAAIVAVLGWPSDHSLQASGTSRLTFSPARPVPGGMMTVRYQPIATLKGASHLVLIGHWSGRPGAVGFRRSLVADSIGTLLPKPDGSYEARVQLPNDFLTVRMAVTDSAAGEVDTDGDELWSAIGGTREGKPSLRSLLTAVEVFPRVSTYYAPSIPSIRARQSVSPADSLKRYFPDHPAGWAYSHGLSGQGSALERLISFFQSAEKKYLVFYERLWPQRAVDAERLHDMVVFSNTISEPGEANKWARRLAMEHPEDPRAFMDLLHALHQVELLEPPALADSIRPWFPVLDRVYQSASLSPYDAYEIQGFARRYADSATVEKWTRRADGAQRVRYWSPEYETSPRLRAAVEADWQGVVAEPCVRLSGKYPLGAPFGDWLFECQRHRASAFSSLARARLLDGDPAAARTYADSSIATLVGVASCGHYYSEYFTGAKASLLLGDTATAIRDLVIPAASRGPKGVLDTASKWLGGRYDSAAFKSATDSARKVFRTCYETKRTEREARMKLRAADAG
jgi:hypothetical protein